MLRSIADFLINDLVELVMLAVGLNIRPSQVMAEIRRPSVLARELMVVAIAVPLLTLLVVKTLPLSPWSATIAILFGISPTAPSLLTAFRRDNVVAVRALAVVAVALASSMLVVPAWLAMVNHFFGYDLRISGAKLFTMLALKAFLPLAIGVLIGQHAPRLAAWLAPVTSVLIMASSVVVIGLLLYLGEESLRLVTLPVVLALVLIAAGSAVVGDVAGGDDLELREILGRVAMASNPALPLAVIATSYPEIEIDLGGLIAVFVIGRALATIPYAKLAKLRRGRSLPAR